MKICERALNFLQLSNIDGDVRLCGWLYDTGVIGNLKDNNLYEIYHGEKANKLRQMLIEGDYSCCDIDACPYLAEGIIEQMRIEIDEIPEYPERLYLGYERICNYQCTSCTVHNEMRKNQTRDLKENYALIESRIRQILPNIKYISANGCGEFFVSKSILKILSEWQPQFPPEEVTVEIESNGSLFDEKHWKQIERFGQYNLKVYISVMSLDEQAYQYLSGCKYPITKIEQNLKFIKSLRDKGIIDYLEIATVVQERNFRTMPDFVKKCLEEYTPDLIRLRPYKPWGGLPREVEWFADVRNPYHPYNREYLAVMDNPIFKNQKVDDWSGGLASETGSYADFTNAETRLRTIKVLETFIHNSESIIERIHNDLTKYGAGGVVVYGYGVIGRAFTKIIMNQVNIINIYDKNKVNTKQYNFVIKSPKLLVQENNAIIIVTPVSGKNQILNEIRELTNNEIISIEDIIG